MSNMKNEEDSNINVPNKEENKQLKESIINNKEKNNYIIAEINIDKTSINENIRLINSFEQAIKEREGNFYDIRGSFFGKIEEEDYYKYGNEKEIKDNCQIEINNKKIDFSYFYKFKEKGKYIIKYIFLKNITKTDFMFCDCNFLTNLNLSNFNTQNVTNMSNMFFGCKSLLNLNLLNFKTQNVTDMRYMFCGCNSLINLNLLNFNTLNVTDMRNMFFDCIFY